jgi:voltage-gated sodium channel
MMAGRANAASKMTKTAEEKRNENKARRESNTISADDMAAFAAAQESAVKDPWRDPELAKNGLSKSWLKLSARIREFAYGEKFGSFVLFCICLAGVLVGIQTYPGMDQVPVVQYMDSLILYVFTLETFCKMFSEGYAFHSFYVGAEWKWNNFDLFIVVACYLPPGVLPGGSSVALLRLLRLARLVKLFKKIPQLQMIIMGLVGGMKSIFYIVILLLLVFYLYGIVGMTIFKDNDPWHYRDLQTTMLTLFRAATLEDWTDLMYLNIFGCDLYSHIYVTQSQWTPDNKMEWCINPTQNMVLSPIFWVTFVVVSALVMLSLFIGAVTMSMTESMEQMKEEQEELTRLRMKEKQMKKLAESMKAKGIDNTPQQSEMRELEKPVEKKKKRQTFMGALGFGEDEDEREQEVAQMTNLLSNIWDGVDAGLMDMVSSDSIGGGSIRMKYYALAMKAKSIVDAKWFQNFIIAVILLAGTLVGLQTDDDFSNDNATVLAIIDNAILITFIVEIVIKFIAEDIYPFRFFRSAWNSFDLLIVVGSLALAGAAGGAMQMLRLLRLLRVLKLVKAFPQLQVIVNALMMGLSSIGFIGIILVLVFYMLAILGMMLFKDNDPWHFGNLQSAMLTLFRCATLEDWTDVMYINMYGCHKYGYTGWMDKLCVDPYPLEGEYWISAIYFVFFVLIGALVLLTLFIGVVSTSMDEATAQQKEEMEIEEKILEITEREGLTKEDVDAFRKVFGMLDLDGGGTIEEEELRVGLQSVGKNPTDKEMADMLHEIDEDDSGEIDPAEFIQFMVNMRKSDQEERAKAAAGGGAGGTANNSDSELMLHSGGSGFTPSMTSSNSSSPGDRLPQFGFQTPLGVTGGGSPGSWTGGGPGGFQGFHAHAQLQVTALTPLRTTATVGADQNFGLPVLQSPTNENWLDMSMEHGRSRKKLPKLGGSARIAP